MPICLCTPKLHQAAHARPDNISVRLLTEPKVWVCGLRVAAVLGSRPWAMT
jgi:hypothetical protein|eukprot:COSAG01_NODE_8833_length_2645_cov_1.747840_5_plen_51_part_00